MALSKQALQKLLDNPGMFSAADMEDETPEIPGLEDEAPMAPEEMLEPSMDEESDEEGVELASADDDGLSELLTTLRDDVNQKHGIGAKALIGGKELSESPELKQLKRLKAGEPMESGEDEETSADVASDMQAPRS